MSGFSVSSQNLEILQNVYCVSSASKCSVSSDGFVIIISLSTNSSTGDIEQKVITLDFDKAKEIINRNSSG